MAMKNVIVLIRFTARMDKLAEYQKFWDAGEARSKANDPKAPLPKSAVLYRVPTSPSRVWIMEFANLAEYEAWEIHPDTLKILVQLCSTVTGWSTEILLNPER